MKTATVSSARPLVVAGLGGLALALFLRLRVAGAEGAHSVVAGAVFGVTLLAVAAACGFERTSLSWRQVRWGVGGAAVLCLPALLHHIATPGQAAPISLLPAWAAVVTLVAVAEELLLRGAVYEAICRWRGQDTAIAVTAIAFALLHVPLYGWQVAPLDLAVGVFLGVLRRVAASVTAPALAHALADLAGWWLR